MTDQVRPMPAGQRIVTRSYNLIGMAMMGRTRQDADGNHFVTRWFTVIGPVVPLGRYYVKELSHEVTDTNGVSTETSRYRMLGTTRLRWTEILTTYLFSWVLVPLVAAGPPVLLITYSDQHRDFPFLVVLGSVAVWLFAGPLLLGFGLYHYRERYAPVRKVVWREH